MFVSKRQAWYGVFALFALSLCLLTAHADPVDGQGDSWVRAAVNPPSTATHTIEDHSNDEAFLAMDKPWYCFWCKKGKKKSGAKKALNLFSAHKRKGIPKNNMKKVMGTAEKCAEACQALATCKTFDFKDVSPPYCYLSAAVGPVRKAGKAWTLYVKKGVKTSTKAHKKGHWEAMFTAGSTGCSDGREKTKKKIRTLNQCARLCKKREKKGVLSFEYGKKECTCIKKALAFCTKKASRSGYKHYELIRKGKAKTIHKFSGHWKKAISGVKQWGKTVPNLDRAQCATLCYKRRKKGCDGFVHKRWSYECRLYKNAHDGQLKTDEWNDAYILKIKSSTGSKKHIGKYTAGKLTCKGGQMKLKKRRDRSKAGKNANACAAMCGKKAKEGCLSFDYSGSQKTCTLYRQSIAFCRDQVGVAKKFTHYELKRPAYDKEYKRFEITPGSVSRGHPLKILYNLNDRQCAHACITRKWCRGANWRKYAYECHLFNSDRTNKVADVHSDVFQLKGVSVWDRIQFWKDADYDDAGESSNEIVGQFTGEAGKADKWKKKAKNCHKKIGGEKTVEQCAMACLESKKFTCGSFTFKLGKDKTPGAPGKCTIVSAKKGCKVKGVKAKGSRRYARKKPFKQLIDIEGTYQAPTEKDSKQNTKSIATKFEKSDDSDLGGSPKPKKVLYSTTPYKCSRYCLRFEQAKWCKGFTYERKTFKCYLWASSALHKDLKSKDGSDHYERFFSMDKGIANAMDKVTAHGGKKMPGKAYETLYGLSAVRCAHNCLSNAKRKDGKCRGFNYAKYDWTCRLLAKVDTKKLKSDAYTDYYSIRDWANYHSTQAEGAIPDNDQQDLTKVILEPREDDWPRDERGQTPPAQGAIAKPDKTKPKWENKVLEENWVDGKGKVKRGIRFNGHQGALLPASVMQTSGDLSVGIEFRMKDEKASGTLLGFASQSLMKKWGAKGRAIGTLGLFVNTQGYVCGDASTNGAKKTLICCNHAEVRDNAWHTAIATLARDNTQAIYLDGELCGTNKARISKKSKALDYAYIGLGVVSTKMQSATAHLAYQKPFDKTPRRGAYMPTAVFDYFYLFGDIHSVRVWHRVLTADETKPGNVAAEANTIALYTFEQAKGYKIMNSAPRAGEGDGNADALKFLPEERAPYYSMPRPECSNKCYNQGVLGANCECLCFGLWKGADCSQAFVVDRPRYDRWWHSDRRGLHNRYGLNQAFGLTFWGTAYPKKIASRKKALKYDLSGGYRAKGIYLNKYNNQHTGIDVDVREGETMHSMAQGIVVQAGDRKSGDWVCCNPYAVTVRSGNMYVTYGHLAAVFVKKGDVVEKGGLIGLGGPPRKKKTGKRRFPQHLHLEMHPVAVRVMYDQNRKQRVTNFGIHVNPYNEFSDGLKEQYAKCYKAGPKFLCRGTFARYEPVYSNGGQQKSFSKKMQKLLRKRLGFSGNGRNDFTQCTCLYPNTKTLREKPPWYKKAYFDELLNEYWCKKKPTPKAETPQSPKTGGASSEEGWNS